MRAATGLLLLAAPACAQTVRPEAPRDPAPAREAFVQVDGTRFTLRGRDWCFAGANSYYLMTWAADPGLRPFVDEILDDAAAMDLRVLRTWAFNDGAAQWNALQTSPGVYEERTFRGLDYVLDGARRRGLRLILTLVNQWDHYGGMNQYVAWSPSASQHDDFYTDASCRQWYRDHFTALANRVHSSHGRRYRDDPTILAWELANEPRCPSDPSGATLRTWIAEMAAHGKSVAPRQLVTTGVEGFYGPGGSAKNPGAWASVQGSDFLADHASPDVDFASFHLYPDHWSLGRTASNAWVRDHASDALQQLGKPVVLGEYGKQRPLATRDAWFGDWLSEIEASATGGDALTGSCFWALYHDAYPDYDGFGVYYPGDTSTAALLAAHAAALAK